MKNIKLKKRPLIFLFLLAIVTLIGGVVAFFTSKVVLENPFKTAEHSVVIEENFDASTWPNLTTKEVTINNKGTSSVLIRLSYNEIWQDEIGNTLSNKINGTDTVTKNWLTSFENDWIYKDGWYYYKKVIPAKSKLPILKSIELNRTVSTDNYLKYDYELDFNYESIQVSKEAAQKLWNQEITIDGSNIEWKIS